MKNLNDFISLHIGDLSGFELDLTDSLKQYLDDYYDGDEEIGAIIDIDEESPLAYLKENKIYLRLNGRVFLPENSGKIDWEKYLKDWADEKEGVLTSKPIEDLIKFTLIIPYFEITESEESGEGQKEEENPTEEVEESKSENVEKPKKSKKKEEPKPEKTADEEAAEIIENL